MVGRGKRRQCSWRRQQQLAQYGKQHQHYICQLLWSSGTSLPEALILVRRLPFWHSLSPEIIEIVPLKRRLQTIVLQPLGVASGKASQRPFSIMTGEQHGIGKFLETDGVTGAFAQAEHEVDRAAHQCG